MIKGIGVDIVEIPRIRKAVETWGDRFLDRIFNPEEICYSRQHASPYPHYAGRFAAKEAVYKALGDRQVTWKDILVVNAPDGSPQCRVRQLTIGRIHLSISHSRYYAVAQAIVETE